MRRFLFTVVLSLVACAQPPTPPPGFDLLKYTAKLVTDQGHGSGLAVGCYPHPEFGYIVTVVTAKHVIQGSKGVLLRHNCRLIAAELHPDRDIALVAIHCPHAVPTPTISFEPPKPLDRVLTAGFPDHLPRHVFEGIIGEVDEGGAWASAAIAAGMSGGPVFRDGKLIGIVTNGWWFDPRHWLQTTSYFLSFSSVRAWLEPRL